MYQRPVDRQITGPQAVNLFIRTDTGCSAQAVNNLPKIMMFAFKVEIFRIVRFKKSIEAADVKKPFNRIKQDDIHLPEIKF